VRAVQWWKRPGQDMGRYRQQYLYRCPRHACRNAVVEPPVLPAAAAIDWDDLGTRIGDRPRPMRPATRARIAAGLARYARPVTLETTWHESGPGTRAWPADMPLTAQTAQQTTALACPPLIVPAGGTWREEPTPGTVPFPARTTRENDALAFPPFVTVHRGAASDARTAPVTGPLAAVTASGNHLGLAVPPLIVELRNNQDCRPASDALSTVATSGAHHGLAVADAALIMRNNTACSDQGQMSTPATAGHQALVSWAHLLVPYYGTAATARPVTSPAGALTARDRYGLASAPGIEVDDVLFRMLKPPEIGRAMAFADSYVVLGTQRERVRQYGNAVTPPVAEVLISALAEAVTGEELPS
jgi:DNA (cytosine-5)-methyltransferase 1